MPADKDLLRRRFENLKKLNLLGEIDLTEEALLEKIEEATDNSQVEYLDDRYLIFTKSMYQDQDDEGHAETCDTLANAEEVILDWVLQEAGIDYLFFAYVYDLDNGVPVEYEIDRRVLWKQTDTFVSFLVGGLREDVIDCVCHNGRDCLDRLDDSVLDSVIETFSFATKAERDAFARGVDVGADWGEAETFTSAEAARDAILRMVERREGSGEEDDS